MEAKLIPLSDFVLEQEKSLENLLNESLPTLKVASSYDKIVNYTNFLKQPLKLGMFVPCDEFGNILEEPKGFKEWHKWGVSSKLAYSEIVECQKFWNDKNKVLFEGFEFLSSNTVFNSNLGLTICLDNYQFSIEDSLGIGGGDIWGNTLEALAYTNLNLTLTPSALNQIGVNK